MCIASGPGKDMFDSTRIIGEKQYMAGKVIVNFFLFFPPIILCAPCFACYVGNNTIAICCTIVINTSNLPLRVTFS